MCTNRRRQKKSKDYGTTSPANQQLLGKTKQERKDRQGQRRGEPGERRREREKQPLRMQTLNNRTFEMKTLTAAHAVTNRCWAVVWFLLKNRRFRGPCKDIFLIILVLKMRTRFPSVILLTNLDQNLLVVNLQLNLWLTSILVTFFSFFLFFPKTCFSVLVPILTHKQNLEPVSFHISFLKHKSNLDCENQTQF